MLSALQLGENAVFIIVCVVLALLAVAFFIVVYVADLKESRRKAKNRRAFDRALDRTNRRKARLQ